MREIKFRVWDGNNNEFIYIPNEKSDIVEIGRGIDYQQYTGLKDKNGQEIYERDIIQYQNEEANKTPYEVPKMVPENWAELLGIGDSEWNEGNNQYSNIEVIGNIYENKDLLLS